MDLFYVFTAKDFLQAFLKTKHSWGKDAGKVAPLDQKGRPAVTSVGSCQSEELAP